MKKHNNTSFLLTMVGLSLIVMALLGAKARAEVPGEFFEVTYYAMTKHRHVYDKFNKDYNYRGIEYRNSQVGIGLSKYKNSYHRKTVMVHASRYWHPTDNIETSLSVAHVTGYPQTKFLAAWAIAYVKYDMFRPKISLIGMEAVALSFSFKF